MDTRAVLKAMAAMRSLSLSESVREAVVEALELEDHPRRVRVLLEEDEKESLVVAD